MFISVIDAWAHIVIFFSCIFHLYLFDDWICHPELLEGEQEQPVHVHAPPLNQYQPQFNSAAPAFLDATHLAAMGCSRHYSGMDMVAMHRCSQLWELLGVQPFLTGLYGPTRMKTCGFFWQVARSRHHTIYSEPEQWTKFCNSIHERHFVES